MRRTLSFPPLFIGKFVLPTLLVGFLAYVIVLSWPGQSTDRGELAWARVVFGTLLLVAIAAGIIRTAMCAKRVDLDEAALYVSDYFTEVRIPLAESLAELGRFG